MMTKINKTALLLLMLCCTLSVSAAAEAEYQKLAKTWTLRSDGSQEYHFEMALTLYTHAAMNNRYGESFIVYDPAYQTLKINKSYTRQKNGTIVQTPSNAFVEVLPKHAADAPAYNCLKEMVVVHTGLELGATIYLDYTITSKPDYHADLDIFEPILQSSPVREYTLTTIIPADKTIYFTLKNKKPKGLVKNLGTMKRTTWKMRNVPQAPTSAYVAMTNGDLPYFAATTYPVTKSAYKLLNKQMDTPDSQIEALVASLVKDAKSDRSKVKAIHSYVATHLASSELSISETSYRFRPAAEVLATAYGTEAEKANLLAVMMKAAGFKAEVLAGYPVNPKMGLALSAINHFYVSVENEKYIFDVNSQARPQHVLFGQTPVYRVKNGTQVELEPAKNYKISATEKISVQEGKWVINHNEVAGRDLLPYFTTGLTQQESRKALKAQDGYTTLSLEGSVHGITAQGYSHLNSKRSVNFVLPRMVDETYTYEIEYPANMHLRTPLTTKNIQNKAGTLAVTIEKNGQLAIVTRSLKLNKRVYTPDEYPAVRSLLASWSDVNSKTLLFYTK